MFEGTVNRVFFTGKFDTGNLHEVSEGKISYYQPQKKSEADPVTAKPKYDSLEYDFLKKADRHFTLKTRPDAFGQPKQSGNRSWYHFAIKNESSNDLKVTLNIVDLNKHSKLYQQGLRPVVRCSGDDYKPVSDLHKDNFIEKNWRRLRWSAIAFGNVEEYQRVLKSKEFWFSLNFVWIYLQKNRSVFFFSVFTVFACFFLHISAE